MTQLKSTQRSRLAQRLIGVAAVLGLAITLSGCIVVPAYGPPHYRPYYYYR